MREWLAVDRQPDPREIAVDLERLTSELPVPTDDVGIQPLTIDSHEYIRAILDIRSAC